MPAVSPLERMTFYSAWYECISALSEHSGCQLSPRGKFKAFGNKFSAVIFWWLSCNIINRSEGKNNINCGSYSLWSWAFLVGNGQFVLVKKEYILPFYMTVYTALLYVVVRVFARNDWRPFQSNRPCDSKLTISILRSQFCLMAALLGECNRCKYRYYCLLLSFPIKDLDTDCMVCQHVPPCKWCRYR